MTIPDEFAMRFDFLERRVKRNEHIVQGADGTNGLQGNMQKVLGRLDLIQLQLKAMDNARAEATKIRNAHYWDVRKVVIAAAVGITMQAFGGLLLLGFLQFIGN